MPAPAETARFEQMLRAGTLARSTDGFQPLPGFGAHAKVLELDIPVDGIEAANQAPIEKRYNVGVIQT